MSVSLAPSPDLAALAVNANATLWAQPPANRRLYLVLGGIEVNGATPSTYNVYLNVPEGAAPTGPEGPGYVGTFSLFGAAGHQHGAGAASHRVLFNVTGQIQALRTGGAPKVTFVRRGPDEDNARPTIGHVLLVES